MKRQKLSKIKSWSPLLWLSINDSYMLTVETFIGLDVMSVLLLKENLSMNIPTRTRIYGVLRIVINTRYIFNDYQLLLYIL